MQRALEHEIQLELCYERRLKRLLFNIKKPWEICGIDLQFLMRLVVDLLNVLERKVDG